MIVYVHVGIGLGYNTFFTLAQFAFEMITPGLALTVNINQSEYINSLIGPSGARVVIHDQHVMPFPNDMGILANPGQVLSVGVRKVGAAIIDRNLPKNKYIVNILCCCN